MPLRPASPKFPGDHNRHFRLSNRWWSTPRLPTKVAAPEFDRGASWNRRSSLGTARLCPTRLRPSCSLEANTQNKLSGYSRIEWLPQNRSHACARSSHVQVRRRQPTAGSAERTRRKISDANHALERRKRNDSKTTAHCTKLITWDYVDNKTDLEAQVLRILVAYDPLRTSPGRPHI